MFKSLKSGKKPLERFEKWLERAKFHKNLFDIVVAIFIGVFCGLGAAILKQLIVFFSLVFWQHEEATLEILNHAASWRIVLIPALGGLLVGPIVYFFAREARGHGVPEVMGAIALRNGIIRARVALAKALASAITISSGGSAGREGPIIQIGSAIGSAVGQALKVSSTRLRVFVGCGAAAGIAATFNAPIAGALFSVEIILRELGVGQFGPIVISSVLATTVARHFFGDTPVFEVPHYELVSGYELGPYMLLGLLCALVSVAFIKILYFTEDIFDNNSLFPGWLKPAIGGLLLGLIGLGFPHVFGDGKQVVNLALLNQFPWHILLILLIAKIVATSLTLGSGGSGGVFAPSLFIGAFSGAALGQLVHSLFGDSAGAAGGYALVAMGGVVAGTTHAPITAILIIFEITDNYSIILPLMTVCIISTVLSHRMHKESIYTLKLIRRGLDIFKKQPLDLMKAHSVGETLSHHYETVPPGMSARDILQKMITSENSQFYIVDEDNTYLGMIHLDDVRRLFINRDGLEDVLMTEDLANEDIPLCHQSENLSQALQKFEGSGLIELPVIDQEGPHHLVGVLRYRDVLSIYNAELLKRDSSETIVSRVSSTNPQKVRLVEGYSMIEWETPASLWGKTLEESNISQRYGVYAILAKKRNFQIPNQQSPLVPNRDYLIEEGDILVIYGNDKDIERIRNY